MGIIRTASSEFGTYLLCEQRRFRRACASVQSRQNLRCSLIQAVSQEEPSDRKPDPSPLWMAGHVQLKFVMTECWKTQIRLTGLILSSKWTPNERIRLCAEISLLENRIHAMVKNNTCEDKKFMVPEVMSCVTNEPVHYKINKMTCAPSKDSDQPGHLPSLIRVFAVCPMHG